MLPYISRLLLLSPTLLMVLLVILGFAGMRMVAKGQLSVVEKEPLQC